MYALYTGISIVRNCYFSIAVFLFQNKLGYVYEHFVDLLLFRNEPNIADMNRLTEQEEETMQAVWKIKQGFIRDFLEHLQEPKPPYTTLASTIKNLEKKGFLKSERMANSYRYTPSIKAEEYKKRFMNGFVQNYFKNSYKDLVTFFAKEQQISTDELKEIIDMIENRKTK